MKKVKKLGILRGRTKRHLHTLQDRTRDIIRETSAFTLQTIRISGAIIPITRLLGSRENVTAEEVAAVIDNLFEALYEHPIVRHGQKLTQFLRQQNFLPNERSTEGLIRFTVEQIILRSPIPIPKAVIDEFWNYFNELFSEPELKGLVELNLDIVRLLLKTYEPIIVNVINLIKETRRLNQAKMNELLDYLSIVRGDLDIIRRQIKALRYLKPFFQADPKDFKTQAQIAARMVREFGPFFIKMAQVAAANSDFLPKEISRELAVFQEDVDPMTPYEVCEAFEECLGKTPFQCYFDFNIQKPLKSGSIGSVYLAKKPVRQNGKEVLEQIIVKIGRKGLEREFLMGSTVIGLALISSHYWAPHSKIAPFLEALQEQTGEFVKGFQRELDLVAESKIQQRFFERSQESSIWNVPRVYSAWTRILEMEYVSQATTLSTAINNIAPDKRTEAARKIASHFLYTIFLHIFKYQEFHGDLHPGNVMVDDDCGLHFIDWGNCVDLKGKWKPLWHYLVGALLANAELLTDALINISSDPERNFKNRSKIRDALRETLMKKKVTPLRLNFVGQMIEEGLSGIHRRLQVILQLMSNTQQMGIVVKSEYLHLSRSLVAMVGTYARLYDHVPKIYLPFDLTKSICFFPLMVLLDHIETPKASTLRNLLHSLPIPKLVRRITYKKLPLLT